jgi:WD40 repeat protein
MLVAFSSDGHAVAFGRVDGSVRVLDIGMWTPLCAVTGDRDVVDGRRLRELSGAVCPTGQTTHLVAFSPDGTWFAALGGFEGTLKTRPR